MRLVGLEILTNGVKVLHYGQMLCTGKKKSYTGKKPMCKIKH